MIASAHFAAGIVVGLSTDHVVHRRFVRVAIAFAAAVVMHLLMDAVPHSDYDLVSPSAIPLLIAGEVLVVGTIAVVLLRNRLTHHWRSCVAAGLLGSVVPDAKFIAPLILSPHHATLVEYYGNRLHGPFHASPTSPVIGMSTQVLCTLILLASFRAFPHAGVRPSAAGNLRHVEEATTDLH
jgi:hypothetical protein